jgi:hypothetical protein
MLIFGTFAGAMSPSNFSTKSIDKVNSNMSYSHNILGEFGTQSGCEPCGIAHTALKNIYSNDWHPFYYITLVCGKNTHAFKRAIDELGLYSYPTIFWDSDYTKNIGATNIENAMERYNSSIIECGNRNVKDIDISLDVEWLGAVNPDPNEDEIGVIVEKNLSWDNTAMDIDVTVDNNEASQYNGHLHVYVTEINSTYWKDYFDKPYTFAFLDYAWNENISISSGNTWSDSAEWDGRDHNSGMGEVYDEVTEDNVMIIAAVLDRDNNNYVDETIGVRTGIGTDPKTFDVYFGDIFPPPKVLGNSSIWEYNPPGNLDFNTTYYWKVDVWDNLGNKITGYFWNFTTRDNSPPYAPNTPVPANNTINIHIDTNLSWYGGDPDLDSVTYDVYFGTDPFDLPKVSANQTNTKYDPSPYGNNLDFNTTYYWLIVAWDQYGYVKYGAFWNFKTQPNEPPYPASDPFPENESENVPLDVILKWNGTDPNSGDFLKYDIYFDDAFPLSKRKSNYTENEWVPHTLTLYQKYYWQIVTWDSGDPTLSTPGPIWWFETGVQYNPSAPVIIGPTEVVAGVEESYTFKATDQNGDEVMYHIDWGDGQLEDTGYFPENQEVTVSHTWEDIGEVRIIATAIDTYKNEGPPGYLDVTVPKNKAYNFNLNLLNWLFEQFPILQKIFIFLTI